MQLLHRPTPLELGNWFKLNSPCPPPPVHALYTNGKESPVRAVAEFEEMGAVLISYPGTVPQPQNHIQLPILPPRSFGIPNELIIRMQQADTDKPVHIFIFCSDANEYPNVLKSLSETAAEMKLVFNPKLIHFLPWDTDTYWTRDYCPWWIYNKGTEHYGVAKHVYTTLGGGSVGMVEGAEGVDPREGSGIFRPNDDYGAVFFSDFINRPIRAWNNLVWPDGKKAGDPGVKQLPKIKVHDWFFTGLLNVGGNYMVTGDGIVASSYLAANQTELPQYSGNPSEQCADNTEKRMQYILEQMNRFLGLQKYIVLTDPSGTYIGHIDCWGKFLGRRKVLIARSQNAAINDAYDNIAKYFAEVDPKDPFTVYRVICQDILVSNPPPATATTAAYTNSLILNKHVYVPIVGGNHVAFDNAALDVYRGALPGYTIVGIPGKPETPWLGTDALHCRTRGVPRQVIEDWLKSQEPDPVV